MQKKIARAIFCYYKLMERLMDMKTAVIHARVSDKKQAEKNLSIPSQLEAGHSLAKELCAEVLREYTEEGVSGWRGQRPEFEEAITYCELNNVDYFITWDTARFSRDSINGPMLRNRLRSSGTAIKYITVDIDPDTESGFILEAINQLTDELKSRNTSRDTKRSLIKNAQAGYFNGGRPPYGYQAVCAANEKKRKRLEINEDEAIIVRRIVSMRINQNVGSKLISDILNKEGYLNRTRKWSRDSVANILRNNAIRGVQIYNKKNRITGSNRPESEWIIVNSHNAIINEPAWLKLQLIMNAASPVSSSYKGSPRSNALFTGILSCGACGSSMQTETANGRTKKYRYYNCRAAQKTQTCPSRRIPVNYLDEWLVDAIIDDVFNDKTLSIIIEEIALLSSVWRNEQNEAIALVKKNIAIVESKRTRLHELLEDTPRDELNLGDITPRLRAHNDRLMAMQRQLVDLESQTPPEAKVGHDDIPILRDFLIETIKSPNNPKKTRDFLQSFIESVEVGAEAVTINYSPEAMVLASERMVHSTRIWRPETPLLRTKVIILPLPEKWHRKAA